MSAERWVMPLKDSGTPTAGIDVEAILRQLAEKSLNINAQDADGRTPAYWACVCGDANALQRFLAEDANSNTKDNSGVSPLVQVLVNLGEYPDPDGCQDKAQLFKVLQVLLDNHVDVKSLQPFYPLHFAILNNCSLEVIRAIFDAYHNDAEATEQRTKSDFFRLALLSPTITMQPMRIYVQKEIIYKQHGLKTSKRYSLLECATAIARKDIMQLCLERGATDKQKNLALIIASHTLSLDLVEYLLKAGADPNYDDSIMCELRYDYHNMVYGSDHYKLVYLLLLYGRFDRPNSAFPREGSPMYRLFQCRINILTVELPVQPYYPEELALIAKFRRAAQVLEEIKGPEPKYIFSKRDQLVFYLRLVNRNPELIPEFMDQLLSQDPPPELAETYRNISLSQSSSEIIKCRVESGEIDPNHVYSEPRGLTLLHLAGIREDWNLREWLLAHRASPFSMSVQRQLAAPQPPSIYRRVGRTFGFFKEEVSPIRDEVLGLLWLVGRGIIPVPPELVIAVVECLIGSNLANQSFHGPNSKRLSPSTGFKK